MSEANVKPARFFAADSAAATFRQRFTPASANLLFLSWGQFDVPAGGGTAETFVAGQEILLFLWKGAAQVHVAGDVYDLLRGGGNHICTRCNRVIFTLSRK